MSTAIFEFKSILNPKVQSITAFINLRLPSQQTCGSTNLQPSATLVFLRPYVRRLIVTAQDTPANMFAFFLVQNGKQE